MLPQCLTFALTKTALSYHDPNLLKTLEFDVFERIGSCDDIQTKVVIK